MGIKLTDKETEGIWLYIWESAWGSKSKANGLRQAHKDTEDAISKIEKRFHEIEQEKERKEWEKKHKISQKRVYA